MNLDRARFIFAVHERTYELGDGIINRFYPSRFPSVRFWGDKRNVRERARASKREQANAGDLLFT